MSDPIEIREVTCEELQALIDEVESNHPEIVGAVSTCCVAYCTFDWEQLAKEAARARDTWKRLMGDD